MPRAERDASEGLVITDLTVRRGGITALDQVSLQVAPGEIVAVLGANGAGKTSLAQAVSGLLPVSSGGISWEGTSIVGMPTHRRAARGIAHCQEGRKLFAGLTVVENLALGAGRVSAAERTERLGRVFEIFPVLAERRQQIATTMSGGQQQMVAIGRALMAAPRLILLDEVTLGLSPKASEEIVESLNRIAATDTALLLVEQDTERAITVASHAYVLARGRVAYDGPPAGLSRERLVAAYLGH